MEDDFMRNRTFGMLIAEYRKENDTMEEPAEKWGLRIRPFQKTERDLSYRDVNSLPKLAGICWDIGGSG